MGVGRKEGRWNSRGCRIGHCESEKKKLQQDCEFMTPKNKKDTTEKEKETMMYLRLNLVTGVHVGRRNHFGVLLNAQFRHAGGVDRSFLGEERLGLGVILGFTVLGVRSSRFTENRTTNQTAAGSCGRSKGRSSAKNGKSSNKGELHGSGGDNVAENMSGFA